MGGGSSKKVEQKILILGLDNSGKTTILRALANEDPTSIMPTQGFNAKSLVVSGQQLICFDVGGQKQIRNYWSHYFGDAKALVWVVDSADSRRLEEVAAELSLCIDDPKLAGVPLLVLANKQDLETSLKPSDICDKLGLWAIRDHPFQIQGCSAINKEGLQEGFDWVVKKLNGK
ncbi:ADP-ribosylation_factor like protein 2a [Hexamita inflata]|uniref:ADP-ribosylation factor like protein 2a n=1 Tax=Hexamita inflata TaxID=28002 RepID=A0AA86Q6B1_9EUKA|nr:ADP-ribosylation factor like protein 2a [Hexamita inflata]CAI9951366.1 ADP-ribosylation factor like protein 2a [Hexamita inflata]CAI9975036.1 ADP-ribosylation factor like protein 2a [Hexamita inflata]